MMPDDPKNEEYASYIKAVTKPINIDAIRVTILRLKSLLQNKLNQKYYQTFDDFISDMTLLFDNFVKFRGERKLSLSNLIMFLDHKMYKYCDAVQKRFDKFVEKAKQRTNLE